MRDLLFESLPRFDAPLPASALKLLVDLPAWPNVAEASFDDRADLNLLVRKGLAKIRWEKTDPIAIHRTPFAGSTATLSPIESGHG